MDIPVDDTPEEAGSVTARPPYPGLRSFAREEADMFFGRDRCIGGMAETLQETRFLAVLGPSGSGKSSLVRSGLFMHLEAGFARKAGSRWTFLDMKHPRTSPYRELARETLDNERQAPGAPPPDPAAAWEPDPAALEARRRELLRDPLALVRWWRDRPGRHENENLLLLVDQFEELFAYATDRERNEVEGFIDLLLESAASEALPVYVVITMRSEFLGGCALFPGLAEQINKSLSLTPRMTRDECRQAIAGPAYGEALNLDPLLVTALLNDMNSLARFDDPGDPEAGADSEVSQISQADLIARRADQLPLMQHVLNWMWTLADRERKNPGDSLDLTLDKYLELGGLRGAMSRHANEVKDSTGDPETVARIFRALTDQPTVATGGSAESSAVRRRRTIAQLAAEANADPGRVRSVVDAFRAEGVSMLTPDPESWPTLGDGDEVDISHESLIRQWSDLRGWIREEGESGRSWQELLRDVDKGKTLSGLDLDERAGWWKRARPHPAWADRYGGEYGRVDEVMTRSRRRQWRRKMLFRTLTGGALVAGVGTYAWAVDTQQNAADKVAAAMREADETARNSDIRSATATRYAQMLRTTAEKERDAARKVAAAAKLQAARTLMEGERLRRQAQAQLAASSIRLAGMERMRGRIAGGYVAQSERQLQTMWNKPPQEAEAAIKEVRENAELLRDTYPVGFAAINSQLARARGMDLTYRLKTSEMLAEAQQMKSAARADGPGVGGGLQAVRLSQAETLEGRALALEGRDTEALQSFERAMDAVSAASTPQQQLVLAEAQAERAGMLFDARKDSEALQAATECTASSDKIPGLEELMEQTGTGPSDGAIAAAQATAALGVRCGTILAILTTDETKSKQEWDKLSMPMLFLAAKPNVDLSLARSEMLIRAFSRLGSPSKEMPEHLSLAFSLSIPGLMEGGFTEEKGLPPVRLDDLYTLDVVQRARALAEGMGWIFTVMGLNDQATDALPLMGVTQDLLRGLPPGQRTPAGMIGPVSDAYRLQAANWIRLEALVQPDTYDEMDKVLPQGATVIRDHEKFLVAALDRLEKDSDPPGTDVDWSAGEYALPVTAPPLGSERLQHIRTLVADRRRALRQQARELLGAGGRQREWERFGSLLKEGEALEAELCSDPAQDCFGLKMLLTEIRQRNSDFALSLLPKRSAAGTGSETAWADSYGFALGGLDPVTCFDAPDSFDRVVSQTRQTPVAAVEPTASRSCNVRMGRLRYAHAWGGRVWLFEREENRSRFERSPETYAPQLGGYDFRAVQQSTKPKQYPQSTEGMIIGGQLYLLQGSMDPAGIAPEDILKVKQNWQSIKAMPESNEPAMEPLPSTDIGIADDPAPEVDAPTDNPSAPPDPPSPQAAKPEDGM